MVKIDTKGLGLAKAIIRYMGGAPRKTFSYPALYREIGHRQGVDDHDIERAVTALEAGGYTHEHLGAGDDGSEYGQRLTVDKGRPMARQLRGE